MEKTHLKGNFWETQMRYFVINLDKRKDRWESMKIELKQQNLLEKTTRFTAIERDWNTVPLEKMSDDFLCSMVEGDKYFSVGAVGAYESHMELWSLCLELDEPIVIFEDDIKFSCNNFEKQLLDIIHDIPTQIDILTFFPNIEVKNIIQRNKLSLQTSVPYFGAYGYYITPTFVNKVKEHMSILRRPFDVQLKKYCQTISDKVACFLSIPYLIRTPIDNQRDSNIVSKRYKMKDCDYMRQLHNIQDCDSFRKKNIPFLYVEPNSSLKFDMIRFMWYNPLSHFIMKKQNESTIIVELFRNNSNPPIIWDI